MALRDGDDGDIYDWMIAHDEEFHRFMDAKDHFEGRSSWRTRLAQIEKIVAARQYKFHTIWSSRQGTVK